MATAIGTREPCIALHEKELVAAHIEVERGAQNADRGAGPVGVRSYGIDIVDTRRASVDAEGDHLPRRDRGPGPIHLHGALAGTPPARGAAPVSYTPLTPPPRHPV